MSIEIICNRENFHEVLKIYENCERFLSQKFQYLRIYTASYIVLSLITLSHQGPAKMVEACRARIHYLCYFHCELNDLNAEKMLLPIHSYTLIYYSKGYPLWFCRSLSRVDVTEGKVIR